MQRICVMTGQPRGGKGTIMRVMDHLLGDGNSASPTMQMFVKDFGLAGAIGKRAILIGDAHLPKGDQSGVLNILKTISGEDAIEVNRKHKNGVKTKLGVIIMACNELSDVRDESGALTGRYSIINFRRTFMGAEDSSVEDKIKAELPGIFNWARSCPPFKKFVETQLERETKDDLTQASNPVRTWAREELVEDEFSRLTNTELHKAFQKFYEDDPKRISKGGLVKSLRHVFPYATAGQWRENGKMIRGLVGLKFTVNSETDELDDAF